MRAAMMPCTDCGQPLVDRRRPPGACGRTPPRRAGCRPLAATSACWVSASQHGTIEQREDETRGRVVVERGERDGASRCASRLPTRAGARETRGCAVQTTRSGTPSTQSTRPSTKSSSPSSAQWRSSKTSTIGAALGDRLEEAPPRGERLAALVTALLDPAEPDERAEVAIDPATLALVGDRLEHRCRSFDVGLVGGIRLEDAGMRLDDLAERPVRDAVAVGKAAALAPGDQLGVVVDDTPELGGRGGSCRCPGTPTSVTSCVERSRRDRAKRVDEQVELVVAPDERAHRWRHRDRRRAAPAARPPPRRGRAAPSLSPRRARPPGRRSRARSRGTSARRRGSRRPELPTEDVRPCSSRRRRPSPPRRPGAASSETSASPVFTAIRTCRSRPGSRVVQLSDGVAHRERRPDGALGVVLVRDGCAEHRDHRVADELLDRAAPPLELVARPLVVDAKERADVLRVALLRSRGGPHEIGEDDADDLALLPPRGRRRDAQRAAALRAELRGRPRSPLRRPDMPPCCASLCGLGPGRPGARAGQSAGELP